MGGMHSHAHVIRAFGGIKEFASAIGVQPPLAIHWPRRGIPAKYWPRVEETEIAKSLGITAAQLMRLPVKCEDAA